MNKTHNAKVTRKSVLKSWTRVQPNINLMVAEYEQPEAYKLLEQLMWPFNIILVFSVTCLT